MTLLYSHCMSEYHSQQCCDSALPFHRSNSSTIGGTGRTSARRKLEPVRLQCHVSAWRGSEPSLHLQLCSSDLPCVVAIALCLPVHLFCQCSYRGDALPVRLCTSPRLAAPLLHLRLRSLPLILSKELSGSLFSGISSRPLRQTARDLAPPCQCPPPLA